MRSVFAIAILTIWSGFAVAQSPGNSSMPRADFAVLDRNGDAAISKRESVADREVAKRFAEFDRNKDGSLSESEYILATEDNDRRVLRDATVTTLVKARLLAARGIPSLAISVETYEGEVSLSGFVGSPELVSRAGRLTATVNGVRTVRNNIEVQ
jgi:hyperosmotically inducible periplasmic protein